MGMAELIIGLSKPGKMHDKPKKMLSSDKSESVDSTDESESLESLGEDLLSAIKSNDASGVVDAIKSIVAACQYEMGESDDDEDELCPD